MKSKIRHIPLEKLLPHPDNANRMSRANFGKLMRHLKQTECYEPLVVRPHPQKRGCFQIINGHHRCEALHKLGHRTAQAVVWNVTDEQTDVLLATLNRLGGRDMLDRKLAILRRLNTKRSCRDLAKLLPATKGQLERLTGRVRLAQARQKAKAFAIPVVFFVTETQQQRIEEALSQAAIPPEAGTRAARRAAALTDIAQQYTPDSAPTPCHPEAQPKDLGQDRDAPAEMKVTSSSKARSFAALRMTNGGRQSHPDTRHHVGAMHASPSPPIETNPQSSTKGAS